MSRDRRGLTLFEILVAASLLLVVLGVMVSVLVPALRASVKGSNQSELQQLAAVTLDRLLGDLERTPPTGTMLPDGGSPVVLGLHPLAGVAPDGSQLWNEEIVVYHWDEAAGTITRETWPPQPPVLGRAVSNAGATRFPADELRRIAAETGGTERILARYVTNFAVSGSGPGPGLVQPLTLQLELQREQSGPATAVSFAVLRKVFLSNASR